ncbi:transposase, partial [Pseudogracilibacillus auburnensis]|nr:transposase [Pseudogracilibacillus auburnensis]
MQHKAYKFRSIPLKANDYTMGCARFVYHHLLCLWHMAYSEIGKGLSYNQCLAMVPKMKRVEEMEWLKEVDGIALQSYTTKYVNQNISIDGNLLKF